MSLNSYTVPIEDGVRVKHNAQARITITSGKKVLEDRLSPAETLGGAITVASIMYNRSSMSGGVNWADPSTGNPIKRPKVTVRLRPEDMLSGDELCTCSSCVQ